MSWEYSETTGLQLCSITIKCSIFYLIAFASTRREVVWEEVGDLHAFGTLVTLEIPYHILGKCDIFW